MTSLDPLQRLRDLDQTSPPQFYEQLNNLLHEKEYQSIIPSLQDKDLEWLVEYLDKVLADVFGPASREFQMVLDELEKISDIRGMLPKSCTPPESHLGCVYEGTLNGARVRIRRVKMYPGGDPQKAKETFRRVAMTWKHLKHPNIIPLLGVTTDPLEFISEWMRCGDLPGYIQNHPDGDRLILLSGVAEGLDYLHSCNIIHGDLKGSNILVDAIRNGRARARITDFGLSTITQDLDLTRNPSAEHDAGPRWIAPEILEDQGTYSKETDVFSFAGVAIEVFSGVVPFSGIPPGVARYAIREGKRPSRPAHQALTGSLWALIQRCWDQEAHMRPHTLQITCSLGIPAWKRLIRHPLALDEQNHVSVITGFFSDPDETVRAVTVLGREDAQSFIDIIDEVLDRVVRPLRRRYLSALCKICGFYGLLPTCMQIPLAYNINGTDTRLGCGGFSDVWKGEYKDREIAVKVLKVYQGTDFKKITRRFCREVITWKTLDHENVLPLLGVMIGNNQFAMASELMANGNIKQFVKNSSDDNRFKLLTDVARGLTHMHGWGVIHGDLKGVNILVDQDCRARVADFGLICIVSETGNSTTSNPSTNVGTTRWMSPELLDKNHSAFKDGQRTTTSDCYALGMVILEVLSDKLPFARDNGYMVYQTIISGEHPERPGREWFTDELWGMLQLCWSVQPKDRPTIEVVLECLARISPTWKPLPPDDCDVEIDAGQESSSTAKGPSPGTQLLPFPLSRVTSGPSQPQGLMVGRNTGEDTIRGSRVTYERNQRPVVPTPGTSRSTSALTSLMKVVNWDEKSQDIERVLETAFEAENYLDCVKNFKAQGIDPQSYIDRLDKIIDWLPTNSSLWKRCLRALSGICGFYGILPTLHVLGGKFRKPDLQHIASSETFNFWRLTDENHPDHVFAVKSLRVWNGDPAENIKEKYRREVIVSKRMIHTNILSIEGVVPELFAFCMVSPWMERGNILEYVREEPKLDRLQLLVGVTQGLNYLHNNEIIHGDLKSPNILIDAEGNPRLYDFANCSFTDNTDQLNSLAPSYTYTIRWSAPERLGVSFQQQEPTKQSDIYSLSMVIVELVTGKVPFSEYTNQNVILMIANGERPSKPHSFDAPGMTSEVWRIAQKCWNERANKRPETHAVLRLFEPLTRSGSKHPQASFFQRRKRP